MACNSTLGKATIENGNYFFGSLMVFISISATLGNLLVLVILNKYNVLKTASNQILGSLATADLLTGAIVAPLHVVQYLSKNVRRNCIVEQMRRYLSTALIGASTLSLVFISYDRCHHLIKLHKYNMKKTFLYSILTICWVIPVLVPFLRKINDSERVYSATIIIVGTINFLTILTAYLAVILSLRQHSKRCSTGLRRSSAENEKRAGVTVFIVITVYILMLVPILLYHGLNSTDSFDMDVLAIIYNVGQCLAISNSSINPLIYCYRTPVLKKFMKMFLRDLYRITKRNRSQSKKNPDSLTTESSL